MKFCLLKPKPGQQSGEMITPLENIFIYWKNTPNYWNYTNFLQEAFSGNSFRE
jgi:hypothetical protein